MAISSKSTLLPLEQDRMISAVTFAATLLSTLGATWSILSFLLFKDLRRIRHQLILCLAGSDLVRSINFLISSAAAGNIFAAPAKPESLGAQTVCTRSSTYPANETTLSLCLVPRMTNPFTSEAEKDMNAVIPCNLNGFLGQLFLVQTDYWILGIGILTYVILADHQRILALIQRWLLIVFAIPWILSIAWATWGLKGLGYEYIGSACGISPGRYDLLVNVVPRWVIMVVNSIIYVRLYFLLKQTYKRVYCSRDLESLVDLDQKAEEELPEVRQQETRKVLQQDPEKLKNEQRLNHELTSRQLANKMLLYPVVYIVVWAIPSSARMYHALKGRPPTFAIQILEKLAIGLHGFVNAILYGSNEPAMNSWRNLLSGTGKNQGLFRLLGSRRCENSRASPSSTDVLVSPECYKSPFSSSTNKSVPQSFLFPMNNGENILNYSGGHARHRSLPVLSSGSHWDTGRLTNDLRRCGFSNSIVKELARNQSRDLTSSVGFASAPPMACHCPHCHVHNGGNGKKSERLDLESTRHDGFCGESALSATPTLRVPLFYTDSEDEAGELTSSDKRTAGNKHEDFFPLTHPLTSNPFKPISMPRVNSTLTGETWYYPSTYKGKDQEQLNLNARYGHTEAASLSSDTVKNRRDHYDEGPELFLMQESVTDQAKKHYSQTVRERREQWREKDQALERVKNSIDGMFMDQGRVGDAALLPPLKSPRILVGANTSNSGNSNSIITTMEPPTISFDPLAVAGASGSRRLQSMLSHPRAFSPTSIDRPIHTHTFSPQWPLASPDLPSTPPLQVQHERQQHLGYVPVRPPPAQLVLPTLRRSSIGPVAGVITDGIGETAPACLRRTGNIIMLHRNEELDPNLQLTASQRRPSLPSQRERNGRASPTLGTFFNENGRDVADCSNST